MADPTKDVPKDPAASMLLLRTIIQGSLDPSYEDAAMHPRKRRPLWFTAAIFLAIVALSFGTTLAAKSLRTTESDEAMGELRTHVEDLELTTSRLQEGNRALALQIRSLEPTADPSSRVPAALQVGAATERVIGPGVVVQVTDGTSSAQRSLALVRDQDLRAITNVLWQAGAEAIAVNGHRIGPYTTVRTAGAAILVNLLPVSSPYVIEAIGEPAALTDALQVGATGQQMRALASTGGIGITVSRAERLILPGLQTSTVTIEEANPTEGDGA